MAKIFLLGIFAVIMVVVLLVYFESKGQLVDSSIIVQQTFTRLQQETSKFADGSSVTYLIPEQPESEKITPDEKVIQKADDENATNIDKAVEQIITPVENVPQYSKKDKRGVVVSGYILLKDDVTGESIKPYNFKVYISIICDDDLNMVEGFNYCSTNDIFGRVTTVDGGTDEDGKELGGFFEYVYHPTLQTSSAFYDVKILVTKDQPQVDGTYKDYEKSYKIQVL